MRGFLNVLAFGKKFVFSNVSVREVCVHASELHAQVADLVSRHIVCRQCFVVDLDP